MSEQTTTEHVPSEGTDLSPESGFTVTTFGSVQVQETSEADFLAMFGESKIVTTKVVAIPAHIARVLAAEPAFFSIQPSNAKRSLPFPTPEAAETFRDQIKEYARLHNLNAYLPKHVPAHWSRKDADSRTGQYTEDGQIKTAKWIKDNGVSRAFNNGTNVTYRLTVKSDPKPAAAGPVTVTQGTPTPATVQSRGTQIIGHQTARRSK